MEKLEAFENFLACIRKNFVKMAIGAVASYRASKRMDQETSWIPILFKLPQGFHRDLGGKVERWKIEDGS